MKPRILLLALATLTLAGAAPSSAKDTTPADGQSAAVEKDPKKNTTVLTLAASPAAVHAAVLEALAAVGCEIKQDRPDYVEGKRSNKIGFAVGSGGEKLLVWIKDSGAGKTELKVVTKKTMMGYVGQKLWNEEVADHVRHAIK